MSTDGATPQDVRAHNDEMIAEVRRLMDLTARVFAGARPEDRDAFLREFAEFAQAFSREAIADPTLRDIMQGRRQAFFWLADHLQLPLEQLWPRYLKGASR